MGFLIKGWKNRSTQFSGRRQLINVDTGERMKVDVSREEGTVYEEGDLFSEENMNDLEQRVSEAFGDVEKTIGELETSIGILRTSVGEVKESVSELGDSVGEVKESVSGLEDSVGEIEKTVSEVKKDISSLSTNLTTEIKSRSAIIDVVGDTTYIHSNKIVSVVDRNKGDVYKVIGASDFLFDGKNSAKTLLTNYFTVNISMGTPTQITGNGYADFNFTPDKISGYKCIFGISAGSDNGNIVPHRTCSIVVNGEIVLGYRNTYSGEQTFTPLCLCVYVRNMLG